MAQWNDIQERISDCLNNKQSNKRTEETMEDVRSQVQTAAEVTAVTKLWKVLRKNENATAEIMEMAFPDKGAD